MLSIKTICCMLATTLFTQLLVAQNRTTQSTSPKPIAISPEGGSFIPIKQAAQLTKRFQHDDRNKNFPYAEKFNKDLILKLLYQKGAMGLRIYFGEGSQGIYSTKNPRKIMSLILVAVDKNGIDITNKVPILNGKLYHKNPSVVMVNNYYFQDDGLALENGQQCLSMCDITSRLYQAH